MSGYSKTLPVDNNKNTKQDYPPALKALQTFGTANAAVSSVITFNDNATDLEVTAAQAPVAIRWIASSDTAGSVIGIGATANFDHVIPVNETRRFVIPKEGQNVQSIVGANIREGLYRRVAWITAGANSSIYGTTY